jgi:hypothetical protein
MREGSRFQDLYQVGIGLLGVVGRHFFVEDRVAVYDVSLAKCELDVGWGGWNVVNYYRNQPAIIMRQM